MSRKPKTFAPESDSTEGSEIDFRSAPEEQTIEEDPRDLKIRELESRLAKLERRESLYLVSNQMASPVVDGVHLSRCRCGKFATRCFTVQHPIAGSAVYNRCDACDHGSPIAAIGRVTVEERPYTERVAPLVLARELNERLDAFARELSS